MIPKFRVMNKYNKKIYPVDAIYFEDKSVLMTDHDMMEQLEARFDKCILMQSTGLTDVNGVEIFEGDIVRIANNLQENIVDYNAQIIFKDGGYCAIDGTEDSYGLRRYTLHRFGLTLEVIGNVHEHPHLLEVDNS